jgi:hypothetical protein
VFRLPAPARAQPSLSLPEFKRIIPSAVSRPEAGTTAAAGRDSKANGIGRRRALLSPRERLRRHEAVCAPSARPMRPPSHGALRRDSRRHRRPIGQGPGGTRCREGLEPTLRPKDASLGPRRHSKLPSAYGPAVPGRRPHPSAASNARGRSKLAVCPTHGLLRLPQCSFCPGVQESLENSEFPSCGRTLRGYARDSIGHTGRHQGAKPRGRRRYRPQSPGCVFAAPRRGHQTARLGIAPTRSRRLPPDMGSAPVISLKAVARLPLRDMQELDTNAPGGAPGDHARPIKAST